MVDSNEAALAINNSSLIV